MAGIAKNAGFRYFGEVTCLAQPAPGLHIPDTAGRAESAGIAFLGETTTVIDKPLIGPNDIAFEHCRTETLIEIVEKVGGAIIPEKLCVIHEIALERINTAADPAAQRLLPLAMQLATARLRS
jgi:hypothetical protein